MNNPYEPPQSCIEPLDDQHSSRLKLGYVRLFFYSVIGCAILFIPLIAIIFTSFEIYTSTSYTQIFKKLYYMATRAPHRSLLVSLPTGVLLYAYAFFTRRSLREKHKPVKLLHYFIAGTIITLVVIIGIGILLNLWSPSPFKMRTKDIIELTIFCTVSGGLCGMLVYGIWRLDVRRVLKPKKH